jgi:hypothetical protein
MKINIETIDHNLQAYPTVGNYWYDSEGVLQIRVSEMGEKKYHMLVVLHELIEEFLTNQLGITEEEITNFDLYYEKRREQGLVEENSEPGFDAAAPYRNQHAIATGVELILAGILGVDWKKYDQLVNSL